MALQRIQPVRRGELIRAGTLNTLIERANRGQVRTGQGISSFNTRDGILLSLLRKEWVLKARIAVVHGDDPDLPSRITYDVDSADAKFTRQRNVAPELGRPSTGNDWRIRPCRVRDLCLFIHDVDDDNEPVARLLVFTETIAPSDCPLRP